ncbi:MAG TPA: hypothetical protein V6D02_10920, partial [Candidatus Obscuribacterales bacterium]
MPRRPKITVDNAHEKAATKAATSPLTIALVSSNGDRHRVIWLAPRLSADHKTTPQRRHTTLAP